MKYEVRWVMCFVISGLWCRVVAAFFSPHGSRAHKGRILVAFAAVGWGDARTRMSRQIDQQLGTASPENTLDVARVQKLLPIGFAT